ncbi:hypothetical protein BGP75_22605 [Motiliproteus sp. MSK22-1]|nr:hypothetical protein BGP75_22605 [Motiliproteus sp. MSK22-1]
MKLPKFLLLALFSVIALQSGCVPSNVDRTPSYLQDQSLRESMSEVSSWARSLKGKTKAQLLAEIGKVRIKETSWNYKNHDLLKMIVYLPELNLYVFFSNEERILTTSIIY